MHLSNVKVGADPEVFLSKTETILAPRTDLDLKLKKKKIEKYISAVGLIGGTKENPRPILDTPGFAVQEDNVAVEFNIPPAKDEDDFNSSIKKCLDFISDEVGQKGLHINRAISVLFPEDQLQTPAACIFGCEPDYNVYKRQENPRPGSGIDPQLRSCGGHIHVSWELYGKKPELRTQELLIKLMDVFIGAPLAMIEPRNERTKLYGQAGNFRFKPYGVEYRTPSNIWIFDEPLRRKVFKAVHHCIAWMNSNSNDVEIILEKITNPILLVINAKSSSSMRTIDNTMGLGIIRNA